MEMNAVVIGGSNIDVCAKSLRPLVKKDSNIGKVEFALGGVGRNIAEDLSLFGANSSLLTAIADDSFGNVVMDNAREQSITLLAEPFTEPGSKTGVYAYISNSDGSFEVGINDMDLTSKISPKMIEDNINALYFTDWVIFEANLQQKTIEKICSYDFKLVADCVSATKCKRLETVLDRLYLLKANLLEACALTGCDNWKDAMKSLINKGLKRGIITLGSEGAMCFEKQNDGIHWYNISNMPDREIVDTSGCGDAMLSGFMIGLMRGRTLEKALVIGQSAACLNADSLSSVNRDMTFTKLKEIAEEFGKKTKVISGVEK